MNHIYKKALQVLILFAFCSCMALVVPLSMAQAQEGQVTREDLNKILQRLDELSKKNAVLEKKNEEVTLTNKELQNRIKAIEQQPQTAPAAGGKQQPQSVMELSTRVQNLESQLQAANGKAGGDPEEIAQLKDDVKELSGIMQDVEKKTLTDKVRIGAELRTRFDWYNYSAQTNNLYGIKWGLGKNGDHPTDQHVTNMPSLRFRLNLATELTNNLRLHARLTMYKLFNDQHNDQYPYENMLNYSRSPTNTDLKVERVYADYYFKIFEKFPMALTFGRLPTTDSFPTDLRDDTPRKSTYPGLAFDAEGDGVALTTDLSQLTQLPDSSLRFVWCRLNPDNEYGVWKEQPGGFSAMDFYVMQLETGLPGRFRDTMLIFNTIYFPEIPSAELAGIPLIKADPNPKDVGNLFKFTLFAESKRFLESRFDLFAGYSLQKSFASGKSTVYRAAGIPLLRFGLLNGDGSSDRTAHAFHAGFRYTFPWEMLNEPKFGFEYNRNSKYWFGLIAGSEDPMMKLDSRGGDTYDFYYIQPINDNFMFRLGYTMLHRKYYGLWMWGQPPASNERISNMYILMDARF